MNLERRLRRSGEEAEHLFDSKPVPLLPEGGSRGPAVAALTALVVLLGLGIAVVFTGSGDPGPADTPASSSTTLPETTTFDTSSGIEPLRLDSGVSLVPVEMEDGTRIAILLPTELVPDRVVVNTGSTTAELEGSEFSASLAYTFCAGETQDAGALNSHGALVAQLADRLVVCRPDQDLTLDIFMRDDITPGSPEGFNLVPMDLGPGYLATIESSGQSPFCCDAFGPLRAGPLVITANRYTSGEVNAWDYQTLQQRWTASLGDSSILLGVFNDLVVATPGRSKIVALEANTGEDRWQLAVDENEEIVGVGNVSEDSVWYVSSDYPIEGEVAAPRLRALDIESGELVWIGEGRPETELQWVDPAVFSDLVVVMDVPRFVIDARGTTTTSHLIAFDRTTGERVWTTDLEDPEERFSDRLLAHDPARSLLVAATPDGNVFSIDPQTGQILWRTHTGFGRIIGLEPSTVSLQQGADEIALDLQTGDPIDP